MENKLYTPPDIMITTVDNPYNPYEDWDAWLNWDLLHGYDSWGNVARLMPIWPSICDYDMECLGTDAILRLVSMFPNGPYTIVSAPSSKK